MPDCYSGSLSNRGSFSSNSISNDDCIYTKNDDDGDGDDDDEGNDDDQLNQKGRFSGASRLLSSYCLVILGELKLMNSLHISSFSMCVCVWGGGVCLSVSVYVSVSESVAVCVCAYVWHV